MGLDIRRTSSGHPVTATFGERLENTLTEHISSAHLGGIPFVGTGQLPRKDDHHERPAVVTIEGFDAAPVRLGQGPHDGESEPTATMLAASGVIRTGEAVKGPIDKVRRKTRT